MNDLIGRTLKGKYLITAPLGEGAMGTVYRGVDTETQRDVAIKVMHPALMREPGMLTRFRREATAMRRVRHPNAVQVFAHGVDQGIVFLAMEFVAGSDLGSRLATERRLPTELAVSIVSEVCGALAVAHALGLVHRDIKPENVMLGGPLGETAKLIDFGVAKSGVYLDDGEAGGETIEDARSIDDSIPEDIDLGTGFDLTCTGTLIGSPGYMAPEQWRSRKVDGRTDVFACGVLLYQLVTGRLPFEDENPMVVAERQLTEQPEPPHALNPAVSPSLEAIILKALQPAPEARFQTAAQMGAALRAQTVEHFIASSLAGWPALGLDATLPLQTTSPLPLHLSAPLANTLPLSDDDSSEPLARTLALPEMDPTVMSPIARNASRNGRLTPVPPQSLARRSSAPPAPVRAPVTLQLRALLAIAAAFLALGVVLGMLLFFPGFRH